MRERRDKLSGCKEKHQESDPDAREECPEMDDKVIALSGETLPGEHQHESESTPSGGHRAADPESYARPTRTSSTTMSKRRYEKRQAAEHPGSVAGNTDDPYRPHRLLIDPGTLLM